MNPFSVIFYSTENINITQQLMRTVIERMQPEGESVYVTRFAQLDRGWEHFQSELNEEWEGDDLEVQKDISYEQVSLNKAISYYKNSEFPLVLDMSGARCRLHLEFLRSVELIDSNIRKGFLPSEMELIFGFHDVYDTGIYTEDPKFLSRSAITLRLWGWQAPNLVDEFEAAITATPEVRNIIDTMRACSIEMKIIVL